MSDSFVVLPKKFWDEAQTKEELDRLIENYMSFVYPGYQVLEIHKYHAICDTGR